MTYMDTYHRSLDDPEGFWLSAAKQIDWVTPPTSALDDSGKPFYRWFPDGVPTPATTRSIVMSRPVVETCRL